MKYVSLILHTSIKTIYGIEWTGHTMPFACPREGGKKGHSGVRFSSVSLLLKGFCMKYHWSAGSQDSRDRVLMELAGNSAVWSEHGAGQGPGAAASQDVLHALLYTPICTWMEKDRNKEN